MTLNPPTAAPPAANTFKLTGDFGQNIMFPNFADEQPGSVYYFSNLTGYNFGVVNHAHEYNDGREPSCHMHAHVYHEGVGKKGANAVASLFIKSLKKWNIIREGQVGGHLVCAFDNCGGQNKNNTMMHMLMYLYELGYFKKITFIFLIAGHTKNACDRLFNSLKEDYRTQNIYTFEDLEKALDKSSYVTVMPAKVEDFLDYTTFFKGQFQKLAGEIKNNHVFSIGPTKDDHDDLKAAKAYEQGDDPYKITLLRSYRQADKDDAVEPKICVKKNWWKNYPEYCSTEEDALSKRVDILKEMRDDLTKLKIVEAPTLNPFKVMEMWLNFRPLVPQQYHNDPLYREPTAAEWACVKKEKKLNKEVKDEKKKMKREPKEDPDDNVKEAKKPRANKPDDGHTVDTGDVGTAASLSTLV
jgi:hypothetical protein